MTAPTPLEETLLALCRIPSFTGEEGDLCDDVEARCVGFLGRDAVARDGHSLVVTAGASGRAPVVLAGHLDVVRTSHDAPPRIDGDRIYGPGAADMKSGLAVMLHLLEHLSRGERPVHDLVLVFYEREEGPYLENRLGDLLGRFAALRGASLAVCLEPSGNALQLGCMGSLHARVIFEGRTSHSARPWQGENAIHKAWPLLSRLAALQPRDHTLDGLLYREVMSCTLAEGGRGRNIIPDAFKLNVNSRFAPGVSIEEAEASLLALVEGEARVEVFDRSPSALPHRGHPLVRALESVGVAAVEPKQAWTDVARFAQAGVAAVNLGPGTQAQAHQRNEYTERASLARGLELFTRWLFPGVPCG
ncbi:MAG: succinyl-diaminopimelate desuccinylase [Deltaproteobacteria bacterium]|nr:succinyl-diaminopimelate desuccinylase [Deltaproteobacteria bacterium]